jgi:hypothetical protein
MGRRAARSVLQADVRFGGVWEIDGVGDSGACFAPGEFRLSGLRVCSKEYP